MSAHPCDYEYQATRCTATITSAAHDFASNRDRTVNRRSIKRKYDRTNAMADTMTFEFVGGTLRYIVEYADLFGFEQWAIRRTNESD